MKYFYLLCCTVLSALLSYGQNTWHWLNPQPTGYNNYKVVFGDHQRGFILNLNGDLLVTTDQGNSWNVAGNFPRATCLDVHDNTGVIGTYTGSLYLSSDNGSTWQAIQPDTADQFQYVNIVSQDSFFVSSASGTIYATGNRGSTWSVYHLGAAPQCFSWVSSMVGYAGTYTGIMKTLDGGKTWQALDQEFNSSASVTTIDFPNADTGYAYRFDSVMVTHDGGNSWQLYGPYAAYQPTTINFVNDTLGFMGGEGGVIYRSGDGGKSWTIVGPASNLLDVHDITSLAFVSADTGFAVGLLGQIWKTMDGGNSWQSYSATYMGVNDVCFPSPTVGYATNGGHLLKTVDSGKTWDTLSLVVGTNYGSYTNFKYLHFVTPDSGFAVTDQTVAVYHTGDGGQTWTQIIPTGYTWQDAAGLWYNGDTAVLSLSQALVRTTDGGNTWSTIWSTSSTTTPGVPYALNSIFCVDANTLFGVYNNGVYKSTNGGQGWTQVYTTYYFASGVWFLNAHEGFVSDEEGNIFRTVDGGADWQLVRQYLPNDEGAFNSVVKFFTPLVGYMTNGSLESGGFFGQVYKTVDGGETWQLSHNYGGVSISFTPDSNVVIGGDGGAILREPIGGGQVDSLSVAFNNSCGTLLTASVGAALGTVDSIQFEVSSAGGKTTVIDANPAQIEDGEIKVSTTLNGLQADTLYTAQMRFRFNGSVAYSDMVEFIGVGIPMPFAGDSLGILVSSATAGNQWYLNGSAIAGATERTYNPTKTGSYTVQTTQNNCVSPMSQPVIYRANDLGVILYPNPVTSYLYLMNTQYRSLSVRIMDMTGRTLMTEDSYGYGIYVGGLVPGQYMLEVIDKANGQKAAILFLKF